MCGDPRKSMMSERNHLPTFYEYCSYDRLLECFEAFCRDQGKARYGHKYHPNYTSIQGFKESFKDQQKIIQDLLESKTYRFEQLYPFLLKKKDKNDFRMICVPSIRDRLVQKMLINYLKEYHPYDLQVLKSEDTSVHGRGALFARQQALAYRKESMYVLKTDISAFFDNLNRSEILKQLRQSINIPEIFPLLESLVRCDPVIPRNYKKHKQIFIRKKLNKGVRQGMPLSPLIASFYLSDFDSNLKSKGIKYVRYADDLIFFLDSYEECINLFDYIKKELSKISLNLPPLDESGKSQVAGSNETITFLGLELRFENNAYDWYIPSLTVLSVRESLEEFIDIKKNASNKIDFQKTIKRMDQVISGYTDCFKDAEAKNRSDFKIKIAHEKFLALSKLFIQFGINLDKLPKLQQQYLLGTFDTKDSTTTNTINK